MLLDNVGDLHRHDAIKVANVTKEAFVMKEVSVPQIDAPISCSSSCKVIIRIREVSIWWNGWFFCSVRVQREMTIATVGVIDNHISNIHKDCLHQITSLKEANW